MELGRGELFYQETVPSTCFSRFNGGKAHPGSEANSPSQAHSCP